MTYNWTYADVSALRVLSALVKNCSSEHEKRRPGIGLLDRTILACPFIDHCIIHSFALCTLRPPSSLSRHNANHPPSKCAEPGPVFGLYTHPGPGIEIELLLPQLAYAMSSGQAFKAIAKLFALNHYGDSTTACIVDLCVANTKTCLVLSRFPFMQTSGFINHRPIP
jgi:hypothetical protein